MLKSKMFAKRLYRYNLFRNKFTKNIRMDALFCVFIQKKPSMWRPKKKSTGRLARKVIDKLGLK